MPNRRALRAQLWTVAVLWIAVAAILLVWSVAHGPRAAELLLAVAIAFVLGLTFDAVIRRAVDFQAELHRDRDDCGDRPASA